MSINYRRWFIFIVVLILLALFVALPQTPQLPFGNFHPVFSTHLGLDLVGGVQALLEADLPATTVVDPASMTTAQQIVENRVNGMGVAEAVVQKAGDRRILVEIPGETDPDKALATVRQTGLLEFIDMSSITQDQALTLENETVKTDFATSGTSSVITPTATEAVTATTSTTNTTATTATLPSLTNMVFHTVMTGKELKNIQVTTNNNKPQVAFELSTEGTKVFSDFTSSHVGKVLAITLDKKVISAPRIDSAITEGRGVISGNFTVDTANTLALQLRYGSLPIPLKVVESNTVGPTLGQESLRKSLIAGAIGLAIVIIFMMLYYRLPGLLADLALLVYALFSYSIFRGIPITLTLPGIAGFILSIGMAVDANILIFERMKEELRAGRSLNSAIDLGWSRAWPSIRDSNISTIITCFILYIFGSTFGASIVKGFSLTLFFGVAVSLFTAIIVTRTFLHLVLDNIKMAEHPRWFGVK